MRTTIPALAAVFCLLVAGFASAEFAAQEPTAAVLDARSAASADLYFDLEDLAVGESFAVAVQSKSDVVRLRSDRTAAGYAVSFEPGAQAPTAVTVRYLNDGAPVAAPLTLSGAEAVEAGVSDEGPDSHHWYCDRRGCVYTQDWKGGDGIDGGATAFTTPAGERVTVTDVEFEMHGVNLGAPSAVQFETPRGFALTAQSFGPTLR